MGLEEGIAAFAAIIIVALIVTNPSGDTAVLGQTFSGLKGLSDSLQKGVK
jgi:hypothetical protein